MPIASVESSTGKIVFNYTISTPSASSTTSIDECLPTLLFIHAVYHGQQIFQRQFEDPQIRRFNCVALDLRLHGLTTSDEIPEGYSAREAAEDVALFMDEIDLPACHIVGFVDGHHGGDQPRCLLPQQSRFSFPRVAAGAGGDIADGRREVAECWKGALQDRRTRYGGHL
ncbi:uncharacterized protein EV420DRAFT_402888 [Desarmillaria tabescens]|uniref:AB hydrolase-1 domain-containing protein n=1 Tax=Armillaria tabescens TaxID=1929756 RepID=A0AA39N5B5_ARMTA|nr:uncharacterized protein EV420DRAFT_402888 [Desarmillaria tabescens]KAK0457954.1 hypothetical protein EV420DRAFT_402888 [Desarmillaria tabescens]